jgi:hypothetical protein
MIRAAFHALLGVLAVAKVRAAYQYSDVNTPSANPGTVGQIVAVSATVDISTASPPLRFL